MAGNDGAEGAGEPQRQKRVNPHNRIEFVDSPIGSDEGRIKHWVCRVIDQSGTAIGSGFLVGPDLVLTCYHVGKLAEKSKNILDYQAADLLVEFDDFYQQIPKNKERMERSVVTVALDRKDDPIIVTSNLSPFDVGNSETHPVKEQLDFALLRLSERIGDNDLEDDRPRGWVTITSAKDAGVGTSIKLLAYPDGQRLGTSEGKVFDAGIPYRSFHDADSKDGSSGGLIYLKKDLSPVGMHIGGARKFGDKSYNFGVKLTDVVDALGRAVGINDVGSGGAREYEPVNIAIFGGIPEGKSPYHKLVGQLLLSDEVQSAFQSEEKLPQVSYVDPKNLRPEHIFSARQSLDLEKMQLAAQADVAFIFVSSKDDLTTRSRLLTAFGFLAARLGVRRVHIIKNAEVDIEPGLVGGQFVHNYYDDNLLDAKQFFGGIVDEFVSRDEDLTQGLFEIVRVALPGLGDDNVFRTAEFGATRTLDIVGLRFGKLSSKLNELFDRISGNTRSDIQLRIAFPGAEVSGKNRYLFDSLQAGGSDTIRFLETTKDLLDEYPKSLLDRVTYVELSDIPTFMVTAADLDYADGRMLIAPVFPSAIVDAGKSRPRLLVHNKLSQEGVYNAYKELLQEILKEEREGLKTWKIHEADKLSNAIDSFRGLSGEPPEGGD
ncbi:serine protease [Rhodobacteraceae bacterium]|nr:serine protease [Paracoccaceae bacterium]